MHDFLFQIALFIYFFAAAGFVAHIITMRKGAERIAAMALLCGFVVHTIAIALLWHALGHPPIVNMHETLSFLAWAMSGSFLLFHHYSKVKSMGAFAAPLIVVVMTASSLQHDRMLPLPPALKSLWLPIHATICLLAYAVLALAFVISIMFLLQERQIKRKRLGGIFHRLPSLDALDSAAERCIKIGFPLLTLGIVTGSIWAEQAWGAYWSWDPKETWSLITWFLYAALLHQRFTVGWRGRRAAIMTIIGFLTLLFTFIGVNYLLPGAHTYATWYD